MRIFRHKHGRSLKVLLAVLLLAMQGAALAHDLAHFEDRDAGMCRVCTVYTGTHGIVAGDQLPVIIPTYHQCGPVPGTVDLRYQAVTPGFPRAPPAQP